MEAAVAPYALSTIFVPPYCECVRRRVGVCSNAARRRLVRVLLRAVRKLTPPVPFRCWSGSAPQPVQSWRRSRRFCMHRWHAHATAWRQWVGHTLSLPPPRVPARSRWRRCLQRRKIRCGHRRSPRAVRAPLRCRSRGSSPCRAAAARVPSPPRDHAPCLLPRGARTLLATAASHRRGPPSRAHRCDALHVFATRSTCPMAARIFDACSPTTRIAPQWREYSLPLADMPALMP
jgi:hypothetical protein